MSVIDADPCVVTTKPFADIGSFGYFGNESEVLFMIGCTFRLMDVRRNDDEHELKRLFNHMKKDYGCGDNKVDLRSFSDVLQKMSKFDLAEKMYRRLLKELPPNDRSLSTLYWSLGNVIREKGDHDLSLQWFHKSLEIIMRTDPSDYINIGNLYNCIGDIYDYQDDNNQALKWYNRAIELFKQANDGNHPDMAGFYNNIALAYRKQKKYSETLSFVRKALAIWEKYLPSDHPDVGTAHNNIGLIHYDLAMEHYHRSLEIRLNSLPPQHPDIAMSYKNIGNVHDAKGESTQALTNYQKAAAIYRHSLPSEHPNVVEIESYIDDISSKL